VTADAGEAVRLSLVVATGATLALTPVSIAVGYWLGRASGPGRIAVESVVMAPLVLPPVVTGYLLLWVFGRNGPIGALLDQVLGVRLPFTTAGAMLAAAVVALPLFVRAVRLAVEAIDPGLESAARSLGATRTRAVWTVTLPLALPGVLAGAALAFARSLGEFGATIVFAGNVAGSTRTLPLAIFTLIQVPGRERAALQLVVLSIALSIGAVVVSELLARRVQRFTGREG